MQLTAKVTKVLNVTSGISKSGKGWQKQDFVIELESGQYPKILCLSLLGDKVSQCPKVGDTVEVSFDVESREWEGRYYTEARAWKVEVNGAAAQQQQAQQQQAFQAPAANAPVDDQSPF